MCFPKDLKLLPMQHLRTTNRSMFNLMSRKHLKNPTQHSQGLKTAHIQNNLGVTVTEKWGLCKVEKNLTGENQKDPNSALCWAKAIILSFSTTLYSQFSAFYCSQTTLALEGRELLGTEIKTPLRNLNMGKSNLPSWLPSFNFFIVL